MDVKQDYPDLVSDSISGPPPMLFMQEDEPHGFFEENTQETLFDNSAPVADYKLPDRALLKQSLPGQGRPARRMRASPRRSSPAWRTSASTRR